ncbi:MAG: PH domain-containing protein [Actinomycetota bacterium]|nr:PH domain-containing protein [Actinomycetota bacterium]
MSTDSSLRDKIDVCLLEGEAVVAVYGGAGAGLLGLTDRRVIVQDDDFPGGRSALTSIPYHRVASVSFVSATEERGTFTFSRSIAVAAGGRVYVTELADEDQAREAHETILRLVG